MLEAFMGDLDVFGPCVRRRPVAAVTLFRTFFLFIPASAGFIQDLLSLFRLIAEEHLEQPFDGPGLFIGQPAQIAHRICHGFDDLIIIFFKTAGFHPL
jgi:hypothetical protein